MGQSAGQQGTSTGSGTPKQSVLRVLYADDDAVNRRLMGRLLRHFDGTKTVAGRTVQCKVELQTVDDGWQAIQALYRAGHVGAAIFRRAVDTMQAHHPHWQGLQEEEEAVRAGHSTSQSQDTPPFDLLLLDIDMPHFSGAQIASFLQESAAGQGASEPPQPARTWLGRVPVLAVTGRSVSFNITHGWARAAGMQQELQAPDWARIAVEEIADESLRGVFHGTLGKPFTAGQLGMVAGLALGYQHSLQA